MGKAKLVYHSKLIYPDGAIREMIIWQLPSKTPDRPHGLKYRLYYGNEKGDCLVRYDNESGKGDHRHIKGKEEPYKFTNVEKSVEDFQKDIDKFRRRRKK
ncbi:MAG TPA: hypothetical protein ENK09_00105 [Nitrospirae bacterium]|nr:hypothetical protein [Nitrospirota bacterium]